MRISHVLADRAGVDAGEDHPLEDSLYVGLEVPPRVARDVEDFRRQVRVPTVWAIGVCREDPRLVGVEADDVVPCVYA